MEGLFGKVERPLPEVGFGWCHVEYLDIFPPLYGEGYDTIELLLNGTSNADWDTVMNNSFLRTWEFAMTYLMLIILFKVFGI